MQERHVDGERYFKELAYSTEKYLLPFMEGVRKVVPGMKVLEIGCGVGGNLLPFVERGCRVNERFHCENIPDGTLRAGDLLGIGCREGHF